MTDSDRARKDMPARKRNLGGRPPLPPEQRQEHAFSVRCRRTAVEAMYGAACLDGMRLGPWARSVLEREARRRLEEERNTGDPEGPPERSET